MLIGSDLRGKGGKKEALISQGKFPAACGVQ